MNLLEKRIIYCRIFRAARGVFLNEPIRKVSDTEGCVNFLCNKFLDFWNSREGRKYPGGRGGGEFKLRGILKNCPRCARPFS